MVRREIFERVFVGTIIVGMLSTTFFVIWNREKRPEYLPAYMLLPPVADPERRTEELGDTWRDETLDLTAFVGMPDPYRDLVSEYIQTVIRELGVSPLMRKRYYHKDRSRDPGWLPPDPFPDDANPFYDREIVVPLAVYPRPEVVKKWTASSEAQAIGLRPIDGLFDRVGSVYGRTLMFEPGHRSEAPWACPPSAFGYENPSSVTTLPLFDGSYFFGLGKVVLNPLYNGPTDDVIDCSDDLHLDEEGGATLLGELLTVPVYIKNTRLRWVSCRNGAENRLFLAYALLDGNGARRAEWYQDSGAGPVSQYVRPLVCERHQPRVKQHDLLLLPRPMGWPPNRHVKAIHENAHEEWCFDDWFPAQQNACWAIREAADSKPLQESFVLMPASEKSDLPVFFIALFAETEPKQLVRELASLYNVSPESTLNSPEAMQRLVSLYEKIRDFSLGN